MKTQQPVWKLVGNLGDENPLEYGGLFVYVDETGVYPPEMERVEPLVDGTYEVRRVVLEDCTYVNGILSDNRFHPEYPAWFADSLAAVSASEGGDLDGIVDDLLSRKPIHRAAAWRAILDYHGWDNGDAYPMIMTKKEATSRYRKHRRG